MAAQRASAVHQRERKTKYSKGGRDGEKAGCQVRQRAERGKEQGGVRGQRESGVFREFTSMCELASVCVCVCDLSCMCARQHL